MLDTSQTLLALFIVIGVVVLAWRASFVDETNQRPLITAIALLIGLLTGGTVGAVSAGSAAQEAVQEVRDVVTAEVQEAQAEVREHLSEVQDEVGAVQNDVDTVKETAKDVAKELDGGSPNQ